jgi:hypothetical protein
MLLKSLKFNNTQNFFKSLFIITYFSTVKFADFFIKGYRYIFFFFLCIFTFVPGQTEGLHAQIQSYLFVLIMFLACFAITNFMFAAPQK